MNVIIRTLLGLAILAVAASAQTTTGDPRCTYSTSGKYWVATSYGGYCVGPSAPSASAQPSNWLDAACPDKEPEAAWRQCTMAAVSAKAEAREDAFNQQVAQQKLEQQQYE